MRAQAGGAVPQVLLDRAVPQALPAPMLDDQQRRVVAHRGGHLLVLAGPGTGKTTTLAEAIVARLTQGPDQLPAESVLALTFGRRAAGELLERIGRRIGGAALPVVSTFHSFAYGVLREFASPEDFRAPPRLLTAAEQDARLRELLGHSVREGRLEWPASLSAAVGTLGIAEQVRSLLGRARSLGLDPEQLSAFGRREGIPVWAAVGTFLDEYLDTLGFEGALDYGELIARAVALAADERRGRHLRERYRLIVVDEYQDTDPGQVRLVAELARGGAQVIAVGDPDQAIYGFRGADVQGIVRFPEEFADPVTRRPAAIEVLRTTRRFPEPIARAAQSVLSSVPIAELPAAVVRAHRSPAARPGPARIEALTFPSSLAQAQGIAELVLAAHAGSAGQPGLDWSQIAVLVRNPALAAAELARSLRSAGVPVWLPPDELALADEPAVVTLAAVLELALDPAGQPARTGRELLAGPLGRVPPVAIRRLARAVRVAAQAEERGSAGEPEEGAGSPGVGPSRPGSADALLTAALAEGVLPDGAALPPGAVAGFRRVSRVVAAARSAAEADLMVSEILWAAWSATDWPDRLRAASFGGGGPGLRADRNLDAILRLFELAHRLPPQRTGRVGIRAFLSELRDLRLPQDLRTTDQSARAGVRLLSAHRAKGLEWSMVVVAGVQEGMWPDLRLRSDLLHVDELGRDGRLPQRTHPQILAEERRLMYVACTRARSALVVTAVAEPYEGGAQPSRFVAELGVPVRAAAVRRAAPMAVPGLIRSLREAACAPVVRLPDGSPDPQVEELRTAATVRLAALAALAEAPNAEALRAETSGAKSSRAETTRAEALGVGPGQTLLAAAHPDRWWGVRALTSGAGAGAGEGAPPAPESSVAREPSVPGAGEQLDLFADPGPGPGPAPPVWLSPSAIESLRHCPLRWFLDRRLGASAPAGPNATLGLLVHAIAQAIVEGEVPADERAISPFVDQIWERMGFPARYQSSHERQRVRAMVATLVRWHLASDRRAVLAEASFELSRESSTGPVRVSGSIDRVDVTPEGSIVLVDFKTGRSAASASAAAENPQLGVYQLAVREGAVQVSGEGLGEASREVTELVSGQALVVAGSQATREDGEPVKGVAGRPRLGGAELVHVGDSYVSGLPKVRQQAPLPDGRAWIEDVIDDAARLARGPSYPARPSSRCNTCTFVPLCPAKVQTGGAGAADGSRS